MFLFQYIDRELDACELKFLKLTFRETLFARIEDELIVMLSFEACVDWAAKNVVENVFL